MFTNSDDCFNHYRDEFIKSTKNSLQTKALNNDNILHRDYLLLNEGLNYPDFYSKYVILENERMIITKYRTGSHHLQLLTGSRYNIPRERRLCKCREIQSLHHVIFDCVFTNSIRTNDFRQNIKSLKDFFSQNLKTIAYQLMEIEAKLKLR